MNILRIVYDWPEPWDGLAPAPYYLSRSQGLLGHKVTVLTGGLNGSSIKHFKFTDRPEKNVKVIKLPRALTKHTGPFLTTSPVALIVYFWEKILGNAKIVHGHGHTMLFFNIYKALFGWIDKTPYIAHFHICAKKRARLAKERGEKFTFLQKLFENPLHNLSDWLGVRVADKCIVVSETSKQDFIKSYGADPEKIVVVESGVPTNVFFPSKSKQLGFRSELIGIGAISPRKGVNLIIEALKYLPNEYIFRWIGPEQVKGYMDELKRLAENLGVSNRVVFSGYIPNKDLPDYLRKAAVYVLPSSYEGFPKVVLEALACGLPAIVSGFRANSEIRGLYYFKSLTPKNIAKDIKDVLNSNVEVDIGKIQTQYSWDAKAREVDRVYSGVLKKPKNENIIN